MLAPEADAAAKGTVLILSTYPIVAPAHGGQVRLLNIKRAYERAGWRVVSIAVYPEEDHPRLNVSENDMPFPLASRYRLFNGKDIPLIVDFSTGVFAASKDGGLPDLVEKIPGSIDVVHCEQPWLWPLVNVLKRSSRYSNLFCVYGSQNIEAPLKRSILDAFRVKDVEDVIDAIEALEKQAASEADLSVAVTQEDVRTLHSWGATVVHVAPNGIEPWVADPGEVGKWRERLPKFPWLLYVASAHPPNFSHFCEIFGGSLGCFPPTSKLVVVGSVAEHVSAAMAATAWSSLNLSRLELLFSLPERDLAAVKSLAHGFVLPIPYGGGSNIKTAEALYSGAYVVGTSAAYRGFEKFRTLPETREAATAKEFQKSVREVVTLPKPLKSQQTKAEMELRQALTWEACLAPLPTLVDKLKRQKVCNGHNLA